MRAFNFRHLAMRQKLTHEHFLRKKKSYVKISRSTVCESGEYWKAKPGTLGLILSSWESAGILVSIISTSKLIDYRL